MAAPSAADIEYQKAHINDDRRIGIAVSNGVCLGVAVIAVTLRYVSRRLTKSKNLADDWWAWIGLVVLPGLRLNKISDFFQLSFTAYIIGYSVIVHFGLGRHTILVTNLKGFVVSSLVTAVLYNFSILAIKLSILYFYRRIFPQRWFKQVLLATGGLITGSTIASMVCDVLQCVPINSQWDPTVKGHCINFASVILASGIVTVVTDFILLCLPMPLIWRLKISASRKRLVMSSFLLGGFACVISTIRLFYVEKFKGADPTWGNVDTTELSTVELGIGMLSACMPAYRPLYNYCFHKQDSANLAEGSSLKKYGQVSEEHGAIRMAGMSRKWHGHRDITENDDEEILYPRFGTVSDARGVRENNDQRRDRDILVTRQFATSNVGTSAK